MLAGSVIPACHNQASKRKLHPTKSFRSLKGNSMEMMPVIVLAVIGVPIVLAVWLIVRAVQARERIEELSLRLGELEAEVILLKQDGESTKLAEPAPKPMPAPVAAAIKVAEGPPIPALPKPVAAPKPVVGNNFWA
jgi:type II secretory pathway pseudopilin PulG